MCDRRVLPVAVCLLIATQAVQVGLAVADENLDRTNAAAWGADHVGQPFPDYMTGDECLFCHRDVGTTWNDNRHQQTIRIPKPEEQALKVLRERRGDDIAAEVQLLMGSQRITRFLKRSQEYGKLDIHSASLIPSRDEDSGFAGNPAPGKDHWDATIFGDRCAGCHTTAVNTPTRAFSGVSLDCVTCHGDVQLEHTVETSHAFLSERNSESRQIVSACGQCHLRGGKSKSSGLPYPNTFVPGDNLFRDYEVDFSDQAIATLRPIDQHIFQNTRDVAVFRKSQTDCLTCHDVHGQSTHKHRQLPNSTICSTCHLPGADRSKIRNTIWPANRQNGRSRVCDY